MKGRKLVWNWGCLVGAALLLCASSADASDSDLVRPDLVACARAVDDLDPLLRGPMQSHCIELAGLICEAPDSGPSLRCLEDLTQDLRDFVNKHRRLLPPVLEGTEIDTANYADSLARLDSASKRASTCEQAADHNAALCKILLAYSDVLDLLSAAKLARIDLP